MRTAGQGCGNCAHFAPLAKQCRARAPVPHPVQGPKGQIAVIGMWPGTDTENWCGEWKEEKAGA